MCGIAGVIYADRLKQPDYPTLKRMGDAIAHRGPDGEGYWRSAGIGLVHRRLAIIDLAGGAQPMSNEDGSVQVVLNGEIYNYRELRDRLQRRGHHLTTESDTEVLVHLYEEVGDALVGHLRGMFAFALWDQTQRRLLLARDRVGIKPLYLYRDAEKVVFGSELKAILQHPNVGRTVNPAAVDDYLAFGMISGRRSIFRGIEKLMAAHTVAIEHDRIDGDQKRYWQLQFEPDAHLSVGDWKEQIGAAISESVRLHLTADVPVGALLSGGVDSGFIVASATRHAQQPLHTFSIGFTERGFDELPQARAVARRFGTLHTDEVAHPDAATLVDRLAWHFDEPFADAAALPTSLVSRLARRNVKVALSGDGGDEGFGGYARYPGALWEASLRSRTPWWARRALGTLSTIYPDSPWLPRPFRARSALRSVAVDGAAAYADATRLCPARVSRSLLAPDIVRVVHDHEPAAPIMAGYAAAARSGDPLAAMLASDIEVRLPDRYLVKVDRASMAEGLEVRPPFLDHRVLELAARIPSSLKIRRGETKWILKESAREVLGPVVRLPKHGFEVPLDQWFRGPLAPLFRARVLSLNAPVRALIDQQAAGRLFRSHLRGSSRRGGVLWALLMLASWADRFLSHA